MIIHLELAWYHVALLCVAVFLYILFTRGLLRVRATRKVKASTPNGALAGAWATPSREIPVAREKR